MITYPPEDLRIIGLLGKGGCGEVYLAESKILGKVAVKTIFLEGDDPIYIEFLNEAELLSKMNSPYIIRFFGTSKSEKGDCIVMEYATNGTLCDHLKYLRKKKLEDTFCWDKRYQIAQDITRGLFCIHKNRVLHRDMKSLNILLDQNMNAKISDFGLSQIKIETQKTLSTLRVPNNGCGSLLWKAPETFSIHNPFTDKADIYSLGIIFWEIASCQLPYVGFDKSTIESSVKAGERLEIPSTCPLEFKDLIKHCWSQDPKQRPDASFVLDNISQIIDDYRKLLKWKFEKAPDFTGNIFEAAKDGKLTSVIYLLANGTNVNSKDPSKDGWHFTNRTALHYAAWNGHLRIVEYLVNQKADIKAKASGYPFGTPLHYAANSGHLSVVEYLVNQKAEINAKNKSIDFLYIIRLLFI